MRDWLTTWVKSIDQARRTNTWTNYEIVVRLHLVPLIGAVKLAEFSTAHAIKLFQDLAGTLSANYRKLVRAVISRAMKDAILAGRAIINPISAIPSPKADQKEARVLTQAEFNRFVAEAIRSRYPVAMLALVMGGLRRGEALALKWPDVSFRREEITINETMIQTRFGYDLNPPKTKQSRRTIKLPRLIFDLLATVPEDQREGLITFTGYDERVSFDRFRREFKAVLRRAGIPNVTIHEIRHSHASLLLDQGVPIGDVSRRLGHSNISTTFNIYGHLIPGEADKSVKAIESISNQNLSTERKI